MSELRLTTNKAHLRLLRAKLLLLSQQHQNPSSCSNNDEGSSRHSTHRLNNEVTLDQNPTASHMPTSSRLLSTLLACIHRYISQRISYCSAAALFAL